MVGILKDLGLDQDIANVLGTYLNAAILATIFLLLPIFTIWVERKVAARFQNRIGPNRVGLYGILQSIPDVLKLLGKELIFPRNADRIPYMLAPVVMVMSVVLIVAVIPLSPDIIGTDLSIGVVYFVAVASIASIAVVMAGWGSNNKYALLGAFRTVAQLISYEVPMIFALFCPILIAGTMSMQGMVEFQQNYNYAFFFIIPAAAFIFLISSIAEIGRAPFDLIEAESELVAGYMIEYSGMAFAMFYLAEFLHAFLVAVLTTVLFFGGWDGPFVESLPVLGIFYLAAKSFTIYFIMLWMRLTLPRFRIDHVMAFNWKFLVPVSIVHLVVVAFAWKATEGLAPDGESGSFFLIDPLLIENLPRTAIMFASSAAVLLVGLTFLRNYAVRERAAAEVARESAFALRASSKAAAGD